MAPSEEPILFLWSLSAWAAKVTAYLALRGIPHTRCEQPITLPRPDLTTLGVNYRRIPLMSIGRDIYCDTLMILEKLEEKYPSSEYKQISASNPTEKALEKLFEKWTDVVVFKYAGACISTDLDLMKDPGFQKDRETLWGRQWTKEAQDALRPNALANLRANWDFLEECLGDGREWLLGSDGPKLADIHACWIFDWLFLLPGSYDESVFNKQNYPRTMAWIERYKSAIEAAKKAAPTPTELEGKDAIPKILKSQFTDNVPFQADPTGLKEGQEVQMYPIDTGFESKDQGKLIGLTAHESVVSAKSKEGGTEIRIHYPRWNFAITPAGK